MLITESSPQPTEHKTRTAALRILVADDHDIFRRGLKQLLTAQPGWEICAEAKTGREAVSLAKQFKPDTSW
jgi:DNA-binding NarL/FixJ family response regulator